jgi:serine phosphatase RsbU (regulator of sigma subunit)
MRALLEQHSDSVCDPGRLLGQINTGLNSILKNTGTTMYATGVMMIADTATSELLYANAGHPKPLHIRRHDSETVPLEVAGRSGALGLFPDATFATTRTPISPGDLIMLFTDGLFEVENAKGDFYSHEDLMKAVRERSALPAPELFEQVLAEVRAFANRADFDDDVCVIGIEVARSLHRTNGSHAHAGMKV